MNQFISWEMLADYRTFVLVIFSLVAFTKGIPGIKKIPTQWYACLLSLLYRLILVAHDGTFTLANIGLYLVDAVFVTIATKGLVEQNKAKEGEEDATIGETENNEYISDLQEEMEESTQG